MKPAREGKGNDQKPKPVLGNSKVIHGKSSTDNDGGQGPGPSRPGKATKGK